MSRDLVAPLLTAIVLTVVAALLFQAFQRQVSAAWVPFAFHPEAIGLLEDSLDDQKRLAREHPEDAILYRERFERTSTLLGHWRILEHNREALISRYEQILLGLFAGGVLLGTAGVVWQRGRDGRRLTRLRDALADLASGRTDLDLGVGGRDTIGRIARMIEQTSRRMARDRRRLRSLENLSAWQEAARRHAHEMKTPLTGARMELDRLEGLVDGRPADDRANEDRSSAGTTRGGAARDALASVRQELDRLSRFTREFTSFARLPRPALRPVELGALIGEFVDTFESAWPDLDLSVGGSREVATDGESFEVLADRDMLRQILVNLCDNAALAIRSSGAVRGAVKFTLGADAEQIVLTVADDGPGVDASVRGRIFEPYVTTRKIGEERDGGAGMGLGLAICRKIALDHGGDLELMPAELDGGAAFRLSLPRPSIASDSGES
ncbi:MAG: ATP-binding protein [Acidobacteriota bacterium]